KPACPQGYREFESHPFRQLPLILRIFFELLSFDVQTCAQPHARRASGMCRANNRYQFCSPTMVSYGLRTSNISSRTPRGVFTCSLVDRPQAQASRTSRFEGELRF